MTWNVLYNMQQFAYLVLPGTACCTQTFNAGPPGNNVVQQVCVVDNEQLVPYEKSFINRCYILYIVTHLRAAANTDAVRRPAVPG